MRKLSLLLFLSFLTATVFAQKNSLDYFLKQATANSPLLKDYQNQLLSLSLDSQLIRAALQPQVNGTSINSYAPVIRKIGYDNVITNGQQVSALVGISKSFISNKTIAARIAALQIQGLAAGNNSRISEKDLRKAITDQYIIVFGGQLELEFNNKVNLLLKKEDTILKKLTQSSVYRQSDYLSFIVTLQQQLFNTSQLEIQYHYDYATLNYLAGIVDTSIVPLADPELKTEVAEDVTTSVFYKQFVLDSLKLKNDKSLIDLSYKPQITATADAGFNSSLIYKPYRNFGAGIGLNITIPIYDGKQKKMQYSKIDIAERTRQVKRDFFMQQQQQQVLQLMKQLSETDKLIEQVNKQIQYTETLITVNEKLLATGDIRITDFILSLNNYFTARNLVTQNYINRLKIINQLNYWNN